MSSPQRSALPRASLQGGDGPFGLQPSLRALATGGLLTGGGAQTCCLAVVTILPRLHPCQKGDVEERRLPGDRNVARPVRGNVTKTERSSYRVLWKNGTSSCPDARTVETLPDASALRQPSRETWSLALRKLPVSEQDRKAGEIQIHLHASSTLQLQ